MSICTKEWFRDLVTKHHQMAEDDKVYVFAVFRKTDNTHIGFVDFSTIMREEFQWARFGYTIHNHFWRKGYGKEAVKAAIDQFIFKYPCCHEKRDNRSPNDSN